MLCHYPNKFIRPNALIESKSGHWGIGAHLCNVAWNYKRAVVAGYNPRFIINMPYDETNVFDIVFNQQVIEKHSASGDHDYAVTHLVNESIKDTPMPILTRYSTQQVIELRPYVGSLAFSKKWTYPTFKGRTLGIHYRGTDKVTDYTLAAPINVCESIPRGFDNVFLATDDIDAFRVITEHSPSIKYNDHMRAHRGERGLHHRGIKTHLFESMVDLLTLCSCDHLFISRSCFSEAAILFNYKCATWSYYA